MRRSGRLDMGLTVCAGRRRRRPIETGEFFEEIPGVYDRYGNRATAARATWVDFATRVDATVAIAVSRQLAELEADLASIGGAAASR
ncbi:MAG TPA: hypothetical protein VH120_00635 [Gemmataceae bacterium]|jgi:hypothetical protein|nr:hypothetical protein [Gemmataceae bacterium]